jgi:hypothetical protein
MDEWMNGWMNELVGLSVVNQFVTLVVDNNRRFVEHVYIAESHSLPFQLLARSIWIRQECLFQHQWTVVALYYWVRELLWRRPRIGKTWSFVQVFEVFLHVGVLLLPVEVYYC